MVRVLASGHVSHDRLERQRRRVCHHRTGLTTVTALPRPERDPERPVYVISVAASIVSVHPRTLRIYEDEGLLCPARTPTNIRLYSENDIRRIMWIRHLTRERGVNLAGIRILFELEERVGARILEALYAEGTGDASPIPAPDPSEPELDRSAADR
jgi:MerR family transcriptional regulator/heat shock protein HspR